MSVLAAVTVPLIAAPALAATWVYARSGLLRQVETLRGALTRADAAAEKAIQAGWKTTQILRQAEARATAAVDQREAAWRDVNAARADRDAVLADLEALAARWESLAPAPGSYLLAGRELREVLARHQRRVTL